MDADQQFWDRIAESYAKKPLPDPTATARKLAVTRALLRPTDRLLDLGCGTGTILLDLAPSVAEAHGIDVSPAMIAIANTKSAPPPPAPSTTSPTPPTTASAPTTSCTSYPTRRPCCAPSTASCRPAVTSSARPSASAASGSRPMASSSP